MWEESVGRLKKNIQGRQSGDPTVLENKYYKQVEIVPMQPLPVTPTARDLGTRVGMGSPSPLLLGALPVFVILFFVQLDETPPFHLLINGSANL